MTHITSSSSETHLALLRAEYVRLQASLQELQRKYDRLLATCNSETNNHNSFVSRLVVNVANLHSENNLENNDCNGDIKINLCDRVVRAHGFVLAARSDKWKKLKRGDVVDMSEMPSELGTCLLRYLYSSELSLPTSLSSSSSNLESSLLQLVRYGHQLELYSLVSECQMQLTSRVDSSNCIRFLATADEIGAEELKNFCIQLIISHWKSYDASDFNVLKSELLLQVLRRQTAFYLHTALRLCREDVVFLTLINEDNNLCNESDNTGLLPLDIALERKCEGSANTLIAHGANVNALNNAGLTCLHTAVLRGDSWSVKYLLSHNADVHVIARNESRYNGDTALHLAAAQLEHVNLMEALIEAKASVNAKNEDGQTPLILAIKIRNIAGLRLLLKKDAEVDLKDKFNLPPLFYSLIDKDHNENEKNEESSGDVNKYEVATILIEYGANVSIKCGREGNTLLHSVINSSSSSSALFLLTQLPIPSLDDRNSEGETPLILAARHNDLALTKALLASGANASYVTNRTRHSALHEAIMMSNDDIVYTLINNLEHDKNALDTKDANNDTPLALALNMGKDHYVQLLIKAGVNVNAIDSSGLSLLHRAIIKGDPKVAFLLLNNGADFNLRTFQGESPVHLAIVHRQCSILDFLCRLGASVNRCGPNQHIGVSNGHGDHGDLRSKKVDESLLWLAMAEGFDLARVLVRYGVDCDYWHLATESNCTQTLLHRALNENNVEFANFLINAGCDINSPRRQSINKSLSVNVSDDFTEDMATPLHLCCQWGLSSVAKILMDQGANLNARDVNGQTPLHQAILNFDKSITEELIRRESTDLSISDNNGCTALSMAVTTKNNEAAQSILKRQPSAAEEYDARGRNFLQKAVMKRDLESVLFLLSIRVNVNSATKDQSAITPILIAVKTEHEMMVRTLLLAGASLGARTSDGETALHLASECGSSDICSILLANGVDFEAVDNEGNNALHVAVREGNLEAIRTLLTESNIQADVINRKGRNVLHTLAVFGQENSSAIFDLLCEHRSGRLPIDKGDANNSSPLLLAYMKGQGGLCRSLVRCGAILGTVNAHNTSIFNCKVATKQLLVKLLEHLNAEPAWGQGEVCEECGNKFSIANRKHHCRHCGRLLCAKCSANEMPIVKFGLQRPVRVCDLCASVISGNTSLFN